MVLCFLFFFKFPVLTFADAEGGGDVELEFILEAEVAQGGADDENEGEEQNAIDEAEQSLHRRILRLISGGGYF